MFDVTLNSRDMSDQLRDQFQTDVTTRLFG